MIRYQWTTPSVASGSSDYADGDAIILTYEAEIDADAFGITEHGDTVCWETTRGPDSARGVLVEINPDCDLED